MSPSFIKVKIKDSDIYIARDVFVMLLDYPFITETKDYLNVLETNQVTILKLKDLSRKAGVPYPLFFSTIEIARIQKNRNDKQIEELIPQTADVILATSRGSFSSREIELIIKDIGRRQSFLVRDIHPKSIKNTFIGSIVKKVKLKMTTEEIASSIRNNLKIDLKEFRSKKAKSESLSYLVSCIESNNIYVAFSTHNYMPQNISKLAMFSGICIKNNFFPYILINTRDGDEEPLFFESEGRQIYTLMILLVCIALNKFKQINIGKEPSDDLSKLIYDIASEIIMPKKDLGTHTIKNITDLKYVSKLFSVTPSMCLARFHSLNLISTKLKNELRKILYEERPKSGGRTIKGQTHKKYLKYNGKKYSTDVFLAEKSKRISRAQLMSALFKKNRAVDKSFINKYKSELPI